MARRVIKQYEVLRKIGSGGSGVVFLANDTLLQRPVVLKLLKRGTQTEEQMRTTQLREARLAAVIDHPNVCSIYEVGEADGEAYIVMQYIPGKSLDKVIEEGPANAQLVLSSGMQIADGLAAAHGLGIFHRDLKPANVMLTDGGLIKILDFGLARQLKRENLDFDPSVTMQPVQPALVGATYTARGGTIAYMAPEQFVTGQSSVQSDIFAVGLILYEMASGRHPFHRPDAQEMQSIRAIQFAEPPPLREIVPDLTWPSSLKASFCAAWPSSRRSGMRRPRTCARG
jgi:serine/threonine protein kinase